MKKAWPLALRLYAEASSRSRASWGLLLVAGVLMVVICGFAALSSARLDRQNLTLDAQIGAAKDALKQRHRSVDGQTLIAPETQDFVQRLPVSIDLQPILSAVQRSAAEAGLAFVGVLVQERPGTKELLSRVDLSVSLRGPYTRLIQVLAETLSRYPNATLTRASLRRAGGPDQVEATMIIALWGGAAGSVTRVANEAMSQADLASAPISTGR